MTLTPASVAELRSLLAKATHVVAYSDRSDVIPIPLLAHLLDAWEEGQRLTAKLVSIEADPQFDGIWPYLHIHGFVYTGPNWKDELERARAIFNTED